MLKLNRAAFNRRSFVKTGLIFVPEFSRIIRAQIVDPSLLFPKTASSSGAFTFANSNANAASGTATTLTVSLTSVAAGDTILLWAGHEGTTTGMTVSDGTTSLTASTKVSHSNNDLEGQWFRLPASVATGTVTYTVTYAATKAFRRVMVLRFTHTATSSFDAECTGGGSENTSVTAHTSGATLTTTGTAGVIVAAYLNYSGNASSARTINGVAATVGPASSFGDETCYRIMSTTVSSAAAVFTTVSGTSVVCCMAMKDQ